MRCPYSGPFSFKAAPLTWLMRSPQFILWIPAAANTRASYLSPSSNFFSLVFRLPR